MHQILTRFTVSLKVKVNSMLNKIPSKNSKFSKNIESLKIPIYIKKNLFSIRRKNSDFNRFPKI